MVLMILPDRCKVHPCRHARLLQMRSRAYAREHQQLGRIDNAARNDDLPGGGDRMPIARLQHLDAPGLPALDQDAQHVHAGTHYKIGPVAHRGHIGVVG